MFRKYLYFFAKQKTISDKMSTKKRDKLSIKDKYDIITKLSDGMNRNELLKEYKLKSLSHLTELLKKKEEIIGKYNRLNTKSSEKSFTIKTAREL